MLGTTIVDLISKISETFGKFTKNTFCFNFSYLNKKLSQRQNVNCKYRGTLYSFKSAMIRDFIVFVNLTDMDTVRHLFNA